MPEKRPNSRFKIPFFPSRPRKYRLARWENTYAASLLLSLWISSCAGGVCMTKGEAEAQAELRRVVEELKGIRTRLRDVAAALPRSLEEELGYGEEESPDAATEVRSIIECVLTDQIDPAMRDLAAAAEYQRN